MKSERKMSMVNHNHVGWENYNSVPLNSPHKRPIRLKNLSSKAEAFDSLHLKPTEVSGILLIRMLFETGDALNILVMSRLSARWNICMLLTKILADFF